MMCVEDTVLVGLARLQALCLCGHIRQELQDVLTKGAFDRAAAELLLLLEVFIIVIIFASFKLYLTSVGLGDTFSAFQNLITSRE